MDTKKEIYREKAKARFDQMNAQIQALLARFNETKADAKLSFKNQFEDLTSQRDSLQERIEKAMSASEDAWQDMRSGLDNAMNELESSFNEATRKLEQITS